jgi:hypothetical protein
MSRSALSIPPLLAFASLDGGLWGVAAGGDPAQLALGDTGAAGPAKAEAAELSRTGSAAWTLRRGEEVLSAVAQPAEVRSEGGEPGLDLIRVAGSLDAGGIGFEGDPEVQADSARVLFAWFAEDHAVGLLAVRPARSRGQDRDELSVVCLGEAPGTKVFDPRLSSTYRDSGLLRRLGVELWLGASEEGDLHSLRVAGEATRAVARVELDGTVIQAQPFTGYSRGHAGVGVYALITRS